jgi:hypothetical protein
MANTITFTATEKLFVTFAQQVVDLQKNFLVSNGKIASGDLVNSISYEYKEGRRGFSIDFLADEYYNFVDQGRRAGARFPPPRPIAEWIKEKRIRPRDGISVEQLTYLISRAISKNGISPTPFIEASQNAIFKFSENQSLLDAFEEDVLNNIPSEI